MSREWLDPNGDGTLNSWTSDGASPHYDSADDYAGGGGSADDDTTYLLGPNNTNQAAVGYFCDLVDTSAGFDPTRVQTISLQIKYRKENAGVSGGADTIGLFAQVFRSDESTAITTEATVSTNAGTSYVEATIALTGTGTHTKANWDGARLRLRQTYTVVGCGDTTTRARVTAVAVIVDWASAAESAAGLEQQQRWSYRGAQTTEWAADGGLAFALVTTLSSFDPATSGPPWTHWLRMRDRDRRPRFSENPPPWVPVPIFDPQLWPATQIGGGRLAGRPWRDVTQPQPAWVYTAFTDPTLFAAATEQQWNSLRVGPRRWYDGSAIQDARIYTAFADPTLFAAALDQTARGFLTRSRGWWTSGLPDTAWIYPTLPVVFDPALYPPSVQLASGFRLGQTQEWISDGGLSFLATPDAATPFDPSTSFVSSIFGGRTEARYQVWESDDLSTFGTPIPYLPQVEQLLRSYRMLGRRWWTSDPTPDAWIYLAIPPFDPALYVAAVQEHDRRMLGRRWWTAGPVPDAWIYVNLPAPPIVTPATWWWLIRGRRRWIGDE